MLRFEAFINNCFVKTFINLTVGEKAKLKGLSKERSKLNNKGWNHLLQPPAPCIYGIQDRTLHSFSTTCILLNILRYKSITLYAFK